MRCCLKVVESVVVRPRWHREVSDDIGWGYRKDQMLTKHQQCILMLINVDQMLTKHQGGSNVDQMLINLGFGALVLICFNRGFIFKYIMVDYSISEIYQIYVGLLGLRSRYWVLYCSMNWSPNSSLSELVMILMIAIITIPSPQMFNTRNIYGSKCVNPLLNNGFWCFMLGGHRACFSDVRNETLW